MKVVYPSALVAFLNGDYDLDADDIRIQLVDADYTYSAAHNFFDDVPAGARIGTAVALTGITLGVVAAGVFDANNPTIVAPAGGDTVTGYIIYRHTGGADSARALLAYSSESASGAAISLATNGLDIGVTFPADGAFKI